MAAEAAAAAVVARLRALPCPPPVLEAPLEPGAALRMLCTPSAPRLALLEWICCRVNPPLAKCLDELRDEPEEVRLNELMALAEDLMLCEAEDRALLEGTAPPEQQLEFIRDLLDAAPEEEEEGKEEEAADGPRCPPSILLRTSALLEEVLATPEGEAVLSPPPLSPAPTAPPGTPPPRAVGPELEMELQEARGYLESPTLGGSPCPAPPLLPVGQDLAALVSAFVRMGLGDPQTHSGGAAPPKLAPCGPMAPSVCHHLRHLQQGLVAVTQLSDLAMESGGGWRPAMEQRLTALQQRFRGCPQD